MLEYGIAMKLNMYGIFILTVVFGVIFKQLFESVLALIALGSIRRFSGGVHFSSLTVCMLITSLFCIVVPMVTLSKLTVVILTLLAMMIYLLRAPFWFEEMTEQKNDTLYKIVSLLLVSSNFIIQSSALAIIFFVQSLTILPTKGGVYFEKDNCEVSDKTH
ncbi:accessory gene regulator B family protein [Paenibacillus apiarius]|uniref:accessory gene regulator B family protein n=1 Tax=Paenibacillus apiarius TaxID=46240 RepID=UPI003B3B3CAD